jgi:GH24 family phage-related lysozyme (muramidase)
MSTVGLKAQLIRDEDVVEYAYEDSLGFLTIGVGHLIDKRRGGKLPRHIIDALLEWDITQKSAEIYTAFPWVTELDEVRKATAHQHGVPARRAGPREVREGFGAPARTTLRSGRGGVR